MNEMFDLSLENQSGVNGGGQSAIQEELEKPGKSYFNILGKS